MWWYAFLFEGVALKASSHRSKFSPLCSALPPERTESAGNLARQYASSRICGQPAMS
jgi:hypothetical protein